MNKKIEEIMLIDDDIATNFLSKRIITKKECCENLSVFNLASEAITHLSERLTQNIIFPTVIFLDLNMPRINGWEFLEIYNDLDLSKQSVLPKIFILTTSINPDDNAKAINNPLVSGFYNKPLNANIIDMAIKEIEHT